MKIVRAYRLGDDGYSVYRIPPMREQKQQMADTFGEVYSFVERCVIKGSIAKPIPRVNQQDDR